MPVASSPLASVPVAHVQITIYNLHVLGSFSPSLGLLERTKSTRRLRSRQNLDMSTLSKPDLEVRSHVETLEAIYFLVQHLDENLERLRRILLVLPDLPRADRLRLRDELRSEVRWVKNETGGCAADREYRDLYKQIRAYEGYYYLDKLYVEKLFTNYAREFPRWPQMKEHAAVIFDGKQEKGLGRVFELEGQCLGDARGLLKRSIQAEKGISNFRKRATEDQIETLMFARAALLAAMTFVEAYLHGIAYDCFHRHHDKLTIADHDLLAEWNSTKKKRSFVDFKDKIFRYPVIVAKAKGLTADLSGLKPAHALIDYAKEFRDALVHPSQFIDPRTGHQSKFMIAVGVNARIAQNVIEDAVRYAEAVEKAIGNDARLSAPWLYERIEPTGPALSRSENQGGSS